MIEDKNNIQGEDDGSLAFLRIPKQRNETEHTVFGHVHFR